MYAWTKKSPLNVVSHLDSEWGPQSGFRIRSRSALADRGLRSPIALVSHWVG